MINEIEHSESRRSSYVSRVQQNIWKLEALLSCVNACHLHVIWTRPCSKNYDIRSRDIDRTLDTI